MTSALNTGEKASKIVDLFLSVIPIIRDGPAAVILPFTLGKGHVKGTLSATTATVSIHWNGKAADRAGESENLPAGKTCSPWTRGYDQLPDSR